MSVIKLNNENFEREVLKSLEPVIVDFYADWCGPCKMMGPVIEELSEELDGRTKVCKVNVDECQDLAISYDVMNIPTIMVYKDGKVINKFIGFTSKDEIISKL